MKSNIFLHEWGGESKVFLKHKLFKIALECCVPYHIKENSQQEEIYNDIPAKITEQAIIILVTKFIEDNKAIIGQDLDDIRSRLEEYLIDKNYPKIPASKNKHTFAISGGFGCGKGSGIFYTLVSAVAKDKEFQIKSLNEDQEDKEKFEYINNLSDKLESGQQTEFSEEEINNLATILLKKYKEIFHTSNDDFRNLFDSEIYKLISIISNLYDAQKNSEALKISVLYSEITRFKRFTNEVGKIELLPESYDLSEDINLLIDLFNNKDVADFNVLSEMIELYNQKIKSKIAESLLDYQNKKGDFSNNHCRNVMSKMIGIAKDLGQVMISDSSWPTTITNNEQWVAEGNSSSGIHVVIPIEAQLNRIEARRKETGRGIDPYQAINNRRQVAEWFFKSIEEKNFPAEDLIYTFVKSIGLSKHNPVFEPMLQFRCVNKEKFLVLDEKILELLGQDLSINPNIESNKPQIFNEKGELNPDLFTNPNPKVVAIEKLKSLSDKGVKVCLYNKEKSLVNIMKDGSAIENEINSFSEALHKVFMPSTNIYHVEAEKIEQKENLMGLYSLI